MEKPIKLVLALALITIVSCQAQKLTLAPSFCQPGLEISSPIGCIKSCEGPEFENCPQIFPLLYKPSFCAYLQGGGWRSYTFECRGCLANDVVGITDGACNCRQLGCPDGQQCSNGICIPEAPEITCANILCSPGFECIDA